MAISYCPRCGKQATLIPGEPHEPGCPATTTDALREATAIVDRWVTLHCVPDQIVLTQGAMLNLANLIAPALAEARTSSTLTHEEMDALPAGVRHKVLRLEYELGEQERKIAEARREERFYLVKALRVCAVNRNREEDATFVDELADMLELLPPDDGKETLQTVVARARREERERCAAWIGSDPRYADGGRILADQPDAIGDAMLRAPRDPGT